MMNAVTKTAAPTDILPVDPYISMIERIAMDPNSDLDKLERMMAMKERLDAESAKKAYAAAFSAMQSQLPVIPERGAIKNKAGDVQSTYPLWEDVIAALREPLASNGLSMSFDRRREDQRTFFGCIVTHEQGHSGRAEIDLPRDDSGSKNAVQGEGSTVSYGQRYSSKMLINWTSEGGEDDDGVKAATATITPDQIGEIVSAADKVGVKMSVILTAENVEAIHYLPSANFGRVMANLRSNAAKNGITL